MLPGMGVPAEIYLSMTEAELLSARTEYSAQLRALVSGKAFQSVSGGGKAFTRQQPMVREVEAHLSAVCRALTRLNPEVYPATTTKALHFDFSR
jgi:hypothetical protein